MMGFRERDAPVAKGPVTYCLDELSKKPDARTLLGDLRDAIIALGGKVNSDFSGLEDVLAKKLLEPIYTGKNEYKVDKVRQYLKTYWFDEATGWWPHFQPVSAIYANGLLKTLNASLQGSQPQPIPIESYWFIGHTNVELVTLVNERQVTILIATPPPGVAPSGIFGESSEAWATTRRAGELPNEVDPTDNDSEVPPSGNGGLRVVTYKIKSSPQ
jgi:hypothetical protein